MTHDDRAYLSDYVYGNKPGSRDINNKIIDPPGYEIIGREDNNPSGLEIYAIKKLDTKEVVFVTRGTDSEPNAFEDWLDPNAGFVFGFMSDQIKEAVKFTNDFMLDSAQRGLSYNYSTTGHSKGGGFAQILSDAFGFPGTTLDAVPASSVINSDSYREFLLNEKIQPQGAPEGKFINIFEMGSLVSDGANVIKDFIGETLELNMVHKFGIINQHSSKNFIDIINQIREQTGNDESIYALYELQNALLTSKLTKTLKRLKELDPDDTETFEEYESLELTANQIDAALSDLQTSWYNTLKANNMLDKELSLDQLRVTLPEGNVVIAIKDSNGIWKAKEIDKHEIENNDPNNLSSTDLEEIGAYLSQIITFYIPNNPNLFTRFPDGKIIETLAIAGVDGKLQTRIINEDDLPASKEELRQQLRDLGLSEEEVDRASKNTSINLLENSLSGEGIVNSELISDLIWDLFDYDKIAQSLKQQEDPEKLLQTNILLRETELSILSSGMALRDAIESGDGTKIAEAMLDYVTTSTDYAKLTGSDAGVLGTMDSSFKLAATSLGFTHALEEGDGWRIAMEAMKLLGDIDNFMKTSPEIFGTDTKGILDKGEIEALQLSQAVLSLAQAIDGGDTFEIAESTAKLLKELDSISDNNLLNQSSWAGVVSVASLVSTIANLDDLLDSGDALKIGLTAATTVNDAINIYNTFFASKSASITGYSSYLGYVAAAVQLIQGDTKGAAVTALSTYFMTIPGYGWMLAAALQVFNYLGAFGDGIPEATASFSIDANGNLVMEVGGDQELQASAAKLGNYLKKIITNYKKDGGRIVIDGTMISIAIRGDGSDPQIRYSSDTGGSVAINITDTKKLGHEVMAALTARDRGDRVDTAIKTATISGGQIDIAKVNQILAGYGFVKKGMTWQHGESWAPRYGTTYGAGIFYGGGNVGPQGQHFKAKNSDIKSLAPPSRLLPTQQMGKIVQTASMNRNFAGAGAMLLAMGMGIENGFAHIDPAVFGTIEPEAIDTEKIKPLNPLELGLFQTQGRDDLLGDDSEWAGSSSNPPLLDTSAIPLHEFADQYWGKLFGNNSDGGESFSPLLPDSVFHYRDGSIVYTSYTGGAVYPVWENDQWQKPDTTTTRTEEPENQPESTGTYDPDVADEGSAPSSTASLPIQSDFSMPEDSILRISESSLTKVGDNRYSTVENSLALESLGSATNGLVYQDPGGDIRFEADPGFVGQASFTYNLRTPNGTIIEKTATITVNDVNDLPVLIDDAFTLMEDETFNLSRLLENDTDIEGDELVIDHLRGLENASISLVGSQLILTPESGYHGDIEFSYWVKDRPESYPVMATAVLSYLEQGSSPSPGRDRFLILEDNEITVTINELLVNDKEYDGEQIEFIGIGSADYGTVKDNGDGTITFIPDTDYSGTEAGFNYQIRDESGNIANGFVEIDVLDQREAPVVASGTRAAINEGGTITFTPEEIATFVYDGDGDNLHLDYIQNIVGGTVITENGYLKFFADDDYIGKASFDYQANDNHRGTVQGHLEFDVLPVNDPIDTGNDTFTINEDTVLTTSVNGITANDSDPEGSVITFLSLGAALNGTVGLAADGTISFTPNSNYSGSQAGFYYTVVDDQGLESTGFVSVDVTNINDPPEQTAASLTINEDQPLVLDSATIERFIQDIDGDEVAITGINTVSGGSITSVGGVYTFTPDADYHGPASLSYTAEDANGVALSGTLDLSILSVDDPTDFGNDQLTSTEETPITISVSALMANDSDVDGSLEFVSAGGAVHGSLQISGEDITFTPDTDYAGSDTGFSYTVRDGEGNEATGFVSIQVDNVNDVPEVIANNLAVDEDEVVVFDSGTVGRLVNDNDGDSITVSSVSQVSGGTVSEQNGIYTFTPDAEYYGIASLTYTADDGNGGIITSELTITISSVNDPTDFGNDTLHTVEEQAVQTSIAQLMSNDSDRDGTGELNFISLGEPKRGTVVLEADGTIIFTPSTDYFGSDAGFSYTVRDSEGNEATGFVTVQVDNVNDAPVITGNRLVLDEDTPITFTTDEIEGFIYDADNEAVMLTSVSNVVGGTVNRTGNLYTFVPDSDYYGKASFDYKAIDSAGPPLTGHMDIDFSPVNDLPRVAATTGMMDEDSEITFSVDSLMGGAIDVEDGTELKCGGITQSTHGDAWVDKEGIVHYLPYSDFFGNGTFTYSILDSEGGVGLGTVTIDVRGINDAPVGTDDQLIAWSNNQYENIYSPGSLLANDYDVDFDTLSIVSIGDAQHGTVSLDVNGNIRYIAQTDDWVGIDTFTYTVSDGSGGFTEAMATIDVKINTSPDSYSEILLSSEDIIGNIDQATLLANDSDVDGDVLFISAVGNAEHGTVELLTDGTVRFTPELNYNNRYPGKASFEYTVSDGISDPVTTVAFVDLKPVNDAPIIVPEQISGAVEDNSFSFTVDQLIANDYDIEQQSPYETDSFTFTGVRGAAHGSITWDQSTGTIYYVPDANFCWTETFQYELTDSHGAVTVADSYIWVEPVNDNPVAQVDYGSTAETLIWNRYSVSSLLSNDYDVDGDSLSITNVHVTRGSASAGVSGGYLQVRPSQGERYVEVSYTVSDGHGGTAPSKLILPSIIEHNFAPEFTHIGVAGWNYEDWTGAWNVNFGVSVRDQNSGDTLTVSAAQVSHGRVTKYSNSNFNYWGDLAYRNGSFTLTVVDQKGASGTAFVRMWGTAPLEDDGIPATFGYRVNMPVVLDLDGDGIELLGRSAGIGFDWSGNGQLNQTGWVAADDGLLAYDFNGDNNVTEAMELSLKDYLPGAQTDLEGLQAFDTNKDGLFDAQDEQWQEFGVWQDANSNGITDEGEYKSLNALGISSIGLVSDKVFREDEGNLVFGSSSYTKSDGSSGAVGDVGLQGEDIPVSSIGSTPATQETASEEEAEIAENTDAESQETDDTTKTEDGNDTEKNQETNPSEVDETKGSDSSSRDETTTDEQNKEKEKENDLDEAEANRLADQLQNDSAAHDEKRSSEESSIPENSADDIAKTEDEDIADELPLAA